MRVALQMFHWVQVLLLTGWMHSVGGQCPCADVSLCQPLQTGPRHEKVAFMVSNANWHSYDYSQLTTIVLCTQKLDPQLLCLAHSQQVRLVWLANYDVRQLNNATARTEWIQKQIERVETSFTDGLNLDMEDELADGSEAAQHYTQLVRELSDSIHVRIPGSMVRVHSWKSTGDTRSLGQC